jgi:DNA-binding Xre family transcriptional regulator
LHYSARLGYKSPYIYLRVLIMKNNYTQATYAQAMLEAEQKLMKKIDKYSCIGFQVKKRLRVHKLSIRDLAEHTTIPLKTLNNIIYGYIDHPSVHTIKHIADHLECRIDDLLEGPSIANTNQQQDNTKQAAPTPPPPKTIEELKTELMTLAYDQVGTTCETLGVTLTNEDRKSAIHSVINTFLPVSKKANCATIDPIFVELLISTLGTVNQ